MPTTTKPSVSWIIVRDLNKKKLFTDKSSTRETYRRSEQFEVLPPTFPTRAEARAYIKENKE